MSIVNAIINFVVQLISFVLRENKKPKKVEVLGNDKEIKDDMEKGLEDQIGVPRSCCDFEEDK